MNSDAASNWAAGPTSRGRAIVMAADATLGDPADKDRGGDQDGRWAFMPRAWPAVDAACQARAVGGGCYESPPTCGATVLTQLSPFAASQLVDQVIAPRSPG